MQKKSSQLLIGAHTSAAGGVFNALLEGQEIGATTIQLFTNNQRQWAAKPLSPEAIEMWKRTLQATGMQKVMSHDSYLINLGAPDPVNLEKSRCAFRQEIERCVALGITYLNFHPGAALESDREACLDLICASLLETQDAIVGSTTTLLLEATAGQGSVVGCTFEELAYIMDKTKHKLPIGVCIDTCHIFVAGYDIRTPEAWDKTLKEFDRTVGLSHLHALHVNDSAKPFGSRVDRHADLGKGEIGLESFKFMMTDPRLRNLPKYLETPSGPEVWKQEIALLREFANEVLTHAQ